MPGTKGQSTQVKCKKEDKEFKEATGQCLLFFVYRSQYDQRMRNAIVKLSGRIKCYGGQILGISSELKVTAPEGSPWLDHDDYIAAAFTFPNQEKAHFWFVSEKDVKQHDFPPPCDGLMVFSVPVRYIPKPGRMTFCWTETTDITDKRSFQEAFVEKVSNLYDTKEVNHGVVYIKDKEQGQLQRLKDCWIQQGAYYRMDLYTSEQEFQEIFTSDSYQSLRQTRDSLSETTTVRFTINSQLSPKPENCN